MFISGKPVFCQDLWQSPDSKRVTGEKTALQKIQRRLTSPKNALPHLCPKSLMDYQGPPMTSVETSNSVLIVTELQVSKLKWTFQII